MDFLGISGLFDNFLIASYRIHVLYFKSPKNTRDRTAMAPSTHSPSQQLHYKQVQVWFHHMAHIQIWCHGMTQKIVERGKERVLVAPFPLASVEISEAVSKGLDYMAIYAVAFPTMPLAISNYSMPRIVSFFMTLHYIFGLAGRVFDFSVNPPCIALFQFLALLIACAGIISFQSFCYQIYFCIRSALFYTLLLWPLVVLG